MKSTYSNRTLDLALTGLSLFYAGLNLWNLFGGFDFFSAYLLRIAFALTSLVSLLALLSPKLNGERFSRIFILTMLVLPALMLAYQFLVDWTVYGMFRSELFAQPWIVAKFLGGIVLFYLSLKFSKQRREDQIRDFGFLGMAVGIFTICYVVTRTVESVQIPELSLYPTWKIASKSLIGLTILLLGLMLYRGKARVKRTLVGMMLLTLILGLI